MILKVFHPVKRRFSKVHKEEIEIEVILRIGTLEDLCDDLGIQFYEIKDFMTKNSFDFSHLLLYHGYVTACEKKRPPVAPVYTQVHAALWYEYLSVTEKTKFINEMAVLFGKMVKAYKPIDKKKVKTEQPSETLEPSPLVS